MRFRSGDWLCCARRFPVLAEAFLQNETAERWFSFRFQNLGSFWKTKRVVTELQSFSFACFVLRKEAPNTEL